MEPVRLPPADFGSDQASGRRRFRSFTLLEGLERIRILPIVVNGRSGMLATALRRLSLIFCVTGVLVSCSATNTRNTSEIVLEIPLTNYVPFENIAEQSDYTFCLVNNSLVRDHQVSPAEEVIPIIGQACSEEYASWVKARQSVDAAESSNFYPLKENNEYARIILLEAKAALSKLSSYERSVLLRR